jgi:hypothetical protein
MGACITRHKLNNSATAPQRNIRIRFRNGQQNAATRPANQAMTGVLLDAVATITVAPTAPVIARNFDFPLFHSRTNRGITVAPNDPANNEC